MKMTFIAEELKASPEAFFMFGRLSEPPIPTNARGSASSARNPAVKLTTDGIFMLK